MSRSLKKGPYYIPKLLERIKKAKANGTKVKTWYRDCTILPEMVGANLSVHSGKNFFDIYLTEEMVGHKLGEFVETVKFVKHGGKKAVA